jgi:hypothetical protein
MKNDNLLKEQNMTDVADKIDEWMDSSTLFGDLRDALLGRLRAMPKPWSVMSEAEQQELIEGTERVASHLVRNAVKLIAANGRASIDATLEQATVKDGIKAVITLSQRHPLRHELTDAVGKAVLIVVADVTEFMGEKAPAKPDPEEPSLPISDSGNVKPFKGK